MTESKPSIRDNALCTTSEIVALPLLIPLSVFFGMRCSKKTGSGLFPPSSQLSLSDSDSVEEDPVPSDVDDAVEDEDGEGVADFLF